ncbi:MAG: restriction endonuclease [Planctomycetes bacterium]|nr:restriction endonuclease [Planctomycetota bacterium]
MIYNFRIDRKNVPEIIKRLEKQNMLSQGWGGGSEATLNIDDENYTIKCKDHYELASTRIPTNLQRIMDFQDGDIIVTPHLPENGKLSIHLIDGTYPHCYVYLSKDEYHLNNRIRIRKSYGLIGNISIYNHKLASWYGRLQWLRLPILQIERDFTAFQEIIAELEKNPAAQIEKSYLDDYLNSLTNKTIRSVRDELRKINPSNSNISFESVCENLLSSYGYVVQHKHVFDRKGGDVDLWCTRERSDISPFETGQVTLFVQVKKHEGSTDEEAVKQVLQLMKENLTADGCVMSLADDFTRKAQELAEQNGVLLLEGNSIARLLLSTTLGG